MSPDRWKHVQAVFHAVLEKQPDERSRLLSVLCSEDDGLREEVESLLKSHDSSEEFLGNPVFHAKPAADELAREPASPSLAGTALDHYLLVSLLGSGGMGEVYRAHDQRLGRDVALKILPPHQSGGDVSVRRFEQEVRAVSSFSHPNICHLYDIGYWQGRPYFTMELLEGRTLRDHIGGRALSIREVIDFGMQIATALEIAHAKGIVHRDIKPANLFVTAAGPLKVMDFGLAKRSAKGGGSGDPTASAVRTLAGAAMGTVAYMSPEQARAEDLDARTDLFSLGVVLYEMATGQQPFRGSSGAVVFGAILTQNPVAPSQLNGEIPEDLERVILTALEKDREVRFQSAAELRAALKRAQRSFDTPAAGQVVPVAVNAGATTPGADSTPARSLAVIPFQMLSHESADDAYLGLGLADAVITRLSGMKRLIVRPTSAVYRYAGQPADLQTAGRELGVNYVIGGLVRRSSDQVRITVQLVSVRSGAQLWGAQLDETFISLMRLEDSLARLTAEAIIPRLNAEERELLGKRDTNNPLAYDAWLRGRYHWSTYRPEGMAQALVCFMDAIGKDPKFARAHAGVAEYYNWAGAWNVLPPAESFAAAKDAAVRALELDSALAETQAAYGRAIWNNELAWREAEQALNRALDLNESYLLAHTSLAFLMSAEGRHRQAVARARAAAALDPFSPGVAACLCLALFNAGELDQTVDAAKKAGGTDSNPTAMLGAAWALSEMNRGAEAISQARLALSISREDPWALATLAFALASAGDRQESRQILTRLQERSVSLPTSQYHLALIHCALGEEDQALERLEQAAADQDWWIRFAAVDRRLRRLRGKPRFEAIVSKLDIPGDLSDVVLTGSGSVASSAPVNRARSKPKRAIWIAAAAAAVVAAFGAYWLQFAKPAGMVFRAPQFTKITTTGNATAAAISPDGQYVAYALDEGGKSSLWVRQVSIANGVRILPKSDFIYRGLTFSRDGAWIYYVIYDNNQITRGALYRVPTLGGSAHKVADSVSGAVSLSPDNRRTAFLRTDLRLDEDQLVVSGVDGSNPATVARRKHPRRFAYSSAPAWSADSKMIAVASEATDSEGFYISVVGVRLKDGAETVLTRRRWQYVEQMAWLPAPRGLLLVGSDPESSFQGIWQVLSTKEEPRPVTNDLSSYYGISITADSSAMVTAQAQTLTNIWMLTPGGRPRRVSAGYGRYFDLSSAGDLIFYASDASGHADIWSLNPDGGNQRQLSSNVHRNYSPSASPDGRSVAFHSNRSGTWNIWRMSRDGGDVKQLTADANDSNWPVWTPDGQSLVYHHIGAHGYQTIWKISADGGKPFQITDHFALRPAVSPKDGTIACWYSENAANPQWMIAVLPPNGGRPLKTFPFSPTVSIDSVLRWTPDGKGISYTDFRDGASNVWVQSIEGGPPRQVTDFNSDRLFSFDWARNGDLIYSRGLRTDDIVLITDAK
ncbi:MAG TPA: protein kinase [Bryobacteraceae bacterium]|nr:protein kinase [Bryobacteraceae bacterium]